MEPETEIVSDAPIGRSRRKAANKATELESALPAVVVASAGEPVVRRLPGQAQLEQGNCGVEEIRELEVVRVPANPRLVLASYEVGGVKQVVRVLVGVNRNFRPRMRLKAQRGSGENAPWKLVGRRPRLPGTPTFSERARSAGPCSGQRPTSTPGWCRSYAATRRRRPRPVRRCSPSWTRRSHNGARRSAQHSRAGCRTGRDWTPCSPRRASIMVPAVRCSASKTSPGSPPPPSRLRMWVE